MQQLRAVRRGPATGRPLQFAVVTGRQHRQLPAQRAALVYRAFSTVARCGRTPAISRGTRASWTTRRQIRYYWHPSGFGSALLGLRVPDGSRPARRGPTADFPATTGSVCRGIRPTGTTTGWCRATCPVPALRAARDWPGQAHQPSARNPAAAAGGSRSGSCSLLRRPLAQELGFGEERLVTPDAGRWIVDRATTVAEHFVTTGTPIGHGFTEQNVANGTAYYTFDVGRVHGSFSRHRQQRRGPNGSIDPARNEDWLEMQLKAARAAGGSPPRVPWCSAPVALDKYIAIFSHHSIGADGGQRLAVDSGNRIRGEERLRDLLLRYPSVIVWVNGHTHRNEVLPHARPSRVCCGRWFLGAEHGGPHRLAQQSPDRGGGRQSRRHPVDLRHHGRSRRPRVARRLDLRSAGARIAVARAVSQRLPGPDRTVGRGDVGGPQRRVWSCPPRSSAALAHDGRANLLDVNAVAAARWTAIMSQSQPACRWMREWGMKAAVRPK